MSLQDLENLLLDLTSSDPSLAILINGNNAGQPDQSKSNTGTLKAAPKLSLTQSGNNQPPSSSTINLASSYNVPGSRSSLRTSSGSQASATQQPTKIVRVKYTTSPMLDLLNSKIQQFNQDIKNMLAQKEDVIKKKKRAAAEEDFDAAAEFKQQEVNLDQAMQDTQSKIARVQKAIQTENDLLDAWESFTIPQNKLDFVKKKALFTLLKGQAVEKENFERAAQFKNLSALLESNWNKVSA